MQHYWKITALANGIIRLKMPVGNVETVIIVPSFFVKAGNRKEAEKKAKEIIDPLQITEVKLTEVRKIAGKKAMEKMRRTKSPEE